jgi:hypothetical protein
MYAITEKKNHLSIHGLFDTKERADNHLVNVIPVYVSKSFFMDKTLTANDFEVIEHISVVRKPRPV